MRILRIRPLVLSLLVAQALGASAPARAQTEGDAPLEGHDEAAIAEARERYAQGAEFFRRERYSAAIAELTEAYRLWQNPTILFALGQAYEGDAQVQAAIDTYQRYLDTTPETDGRRADVESRIRLLNGLLATVQIQTNAPGTVFVNGQEAGTTPGSIRVPTGRHQIEVRAEGYRPERRTLTIAAGTETQLTFTLREEETRTEIIRVTEGRAPIRLPRPVFLATAGVTVAAVGAWAGLGGTAVRRANQYNAQPVRSDTERREARAWGRRADVMMGLAGGLAIGTLVVGLLTDWDGEDEPASGAAEGDGDGDGAAGATGATPEANVLPQRGGALLLLGWRR
ncbi:MAG: PEGA domain-containing protein [Sandaracinaceae bacterium]|nr:PEGA domain-containing protein [Sandaracinaceae bacterium]